MSWREMVQWLEHCLFLQRTCVCPVPNTPLVAHNHLQLPALKGKKQKVQEFRVRTNLGYIRHYPCPEKNKTE